MPFSSLLFVHLFLPIFLLAYWIAPRGLKNALALVASVLFYAWGAPRFLPAVIVLGLVDFQLAHAIARRRSTAAGAARARILLIVGLSLHLSVLGYFKYANFFVDETNGLFVAAGLRALPWTKVVLPIGVSFITFEEISYLLDVYRGDAQPAPLRSHYLLFLMLFPHSIAGPIFRWRDLQQQFASREHDWALVRSGFERFTLGLAKKVLIADSVAVTADSMFALAPAQMTSAHAWLGATAYTLQIYFDFSGYSDMAIGIGRMMGFRFKENFDKPYVSASLTEFWTRWHISLSTWFRDYLYIPLGGNERGRWRALGNLVIVFLLSGLWHGAAWTFVAWGAYHGILAGAERIFERKRRRLPLFVQHAMTLVLVIVGWVFFRAASIQQAFRMILAMGGATQVDPAVPVPVLGLWLPHHGAFAMVVGAVICLAPISGRYVDALRIRVPIGGHFPARAALPLLFLLTVIHLTNMRITPLIYFRF